MDRWTPGSLTAFRAAAAYAAFGFLWVGTTDHLVERLFTDPVMITQAQTAKGWLFVGLSAVIVYALIDYNHRQLGHKNEQLDEALRQISVLHRVLRHNLRNSCNVIRGHAQLIESEGSNGVRESAGVIREYSDQLVELSDRTRLLRRIVTADPDAVEAADLAATIDDRVAHARERHPNATIDVSVPEGMVVEVDRRLSTVLEELVDNAVVHNDAENPSVRIAVEREGSDAVVLEVSDDGLGIPQVERDALDLDRETPMNHSQGIGLLMVKTILDQAEGDLGIDDDESGGTTVRVSIPTAGGRQPVVERQMYPSHG